MKDITENLKNEEDILYVTKRAGMLFEEVFQQLENVMNYKEEKMNEIIKKQEQEEQKLQELKEKVDNVYEDIYDEDDEQFEISCPYCGEEFEAYIDENYSEIKCPECKNSIELDWEGNPNDDDCNGNCSHCGGCK